MLSLSIREIKTESLLFVFSIFTVFIAMLGIVSYISNTTILLSFLIFLLSILFYFKGKNINQWLINIISVILLIYPFLGLSIEDIVLPSTEALTLITVIRLLGKKTLREYFQIYLLSMLLLVASTLFDISWIFLIRVFLILILTVFSILIITYTKETSHTFVERKILGELLRYALIITICSIPLSFLFFFFLPRTPYPLLDIGLTKAKTGFTSIVDLGSVASIEEDRTVVMRITMNRIQDNQLYWRMITFDTFDGTKWIKKENLTLKPTVTGEKIKYTVLFEPSFENYIAVLDFPSIVFLENLILEYPGIYKTESPIDKTLKYNAESFLNFNLYEMEPSKIYLQIPKLISDQFKSLIEKITSEAKDEREIINKILAFLRNYEYSLKVLPKGENPIEDFIFKTKKGNCEYFATSMALMLRIKGIPARAVGGFRGGSYNPFGGYYIIRASDAHLWVEAWIKGRWERFDPSGTRQIRVTEPVIFNILDYIWHNVIINYDYKAQIKLATAIKKTDIRLNKKYLYIAFILILILASFKILRIHQEKNKPLNKFLNLMKKAGYQRLSNEGLEDFIFRIQDKRLKEKALNFIEIYYKIYFKDQDFKRQDLKSFNKILEDINEIIKNK